MAVTRVNFRVIPPLIKTRLAAVTGIPANRIYIVSSRIVPTRQADAVLYVRVRGFVTNQSELEASGRSAERCTRIVDVVINLRQARDDAGSDEQWLMAEDGYLVLENKVIDALNIFTLEDASLNQVCAEPMRLLNATDPRHGIQAPPIAGGGWGDGFLSFEVKWLPDVDLTKV